MPPGFQCKALYVSQIHKQGWVRGDNSDVIVTLSQIHSKLRGDKKVEQVESATQNFVRSTTKYWVRTEDISTVKMRILEHLPVFLQAGSDGKSDSQLTNSVYFDNSMMELYHGRSEFNFATYVI